MVEAIEGLEMLGMVASDSGHIEIEAALAIVSDPEGFSRRIAGMSIASGPLRPMRFHMEQRSERIFHNTYLDTPDRVLDAKRFTFRVRRRSNGKQRMTVKGPPKFGRNGVTSRLEIQADVRYDGLLELLSQMGLQIVQEQKVRRQAYDILDLVDSSLPPLAELAIDAVEYTVQDSENSAPRTVRFHEVEVENKGIDAACIENVVDWLLEVFGDQLRVWTHNKLATGRAIEADYRRFKESGDLTPAAYSRVQECLRQEKKDVENR